jgi:hypothetical protein
VKAAALAASVITAAALFSHFPVKVEKQMPAAVKSATVKNTRDSASARDSLICAKKQPAKKQQVYGMGIKEFAEGCMRTLLDMGRPPHP